MYKNKNNKGTLLSVPFFYAFETNGNLNQVEQLLDLETLNQNNSIMSSAISLNI